MKKYRSKNLSDVLGTAAGMILFLLFTVCMLVMIAVGAATYSRINDGFQREFTSSAAVRYLSNKMRSAESCTIIENGNGAALKNGSIVCIIYCGDDGLYEKTVSATAAVTAEGGDRIFALDRLNITEDKGLLHISVTVGEDSSDAIIRGG
ncbi:MAG: DUF4860 domain-containing protein [Oscillospiraceae bacterium]|nr:DUF4860 domain-containing protein [Oscillospiraceae bacterium]